MATKQITLDEAATILANENPIQLRAMLQRAGYRVMHIYGERVLAHSSVIDDFCEEAMDACCGCERDRYLDLYTQNTGEYFHIYDCPRYMADNYLDLTDCIKTFEVWQHEHDAILCGE